MVRPSLRVRWPRPPPSVSPPTPVFEMIPAGDSQPERMSRVVDVAEQRAALDPRGSSAGSTRTPAHPREIDDEAVVDGAEARRAVPAAADRDVESLVAAEADGRDDVGDIGGRTIERRTPVDHAVLDAPGVLVAGVFRADDVPAEGGLQALERALIDALAGVECPWSWLLLFVPSWCDRERFA